MMLTFQNAKQITKLLKIQLSWLLVGAWVEISEQYIGDDRPTFVSVKTSKSVFLDIKDNSKRTKRRTEKCTENIDTRKGRKMKTEV